MEYRRVGQSGIKVSEISFGTWLTVGEALSNQESDRLVSYAIERGVNFFDTANCYNNGLSEKALGVILKKFPREEVVVGTKCYMPFPTKFIDANSMGLSRKSIVNSIHHSLRRLKLDHIDIYQCHRFDSDVEVIEVVQTMNLLIQQGKILYWGVSKWTPKQIALAIEFSFHNRLEPPISNQEVYNLFTKDVEVDFNGFYKQSGVGFLSYSPLARGVLTGKYTEGTPVKSRAAHPLYKKSMYDLTSEKIDKANQLKELAFENSLKPAALALAYCLKHPAVSSVIIGAKSIEQFSENIQAVELKKNKELMNHVEMIFK